MPTAGDVQEAADSGSHGKHTQVLSYYTTTDGRLISQIDSLCKSAWESPAAFGHSE